MEQYTIGQVAREIGCDIRSIYRWEAEGLIRPPSRVDYGKVKIRVYTRDDLEAIREKVCDRLRLSSLMRSRKD